MEKKIYTHTTKTPIIMNQRARPTAKSIIYDQIKKKKK